MMNEKIKAFIMSWEEKRLNGYYKNAEELIVINTFAETCKMFGYDFEIFRNAENEITEIYVNQVTK